MHINRKREVQSGQESKEEIADIPQINVQEIKDIPI